MPLQNTFNDSYNEELAALDQPSAAAETGRSRSGSQSALPILAVDRTVQAIINKSKEPIAHASIRPTSPELNQKKSPLSSRPHIASFRPDSAPVYMAIWLKLQEKQKNQEVDRPRSPLATSPTPE